MILELWRAYMGKIRYTYILYTVDEHGAIVTIQLHSITKQLWNDNQ